MKTLFLSHKPHPAHLAFAQGVGARIEIIPFEKFSDLNKKIAVVGYFFPVWSFIYSFFVSVKEDILLIDGGTTLYLAVFLKWRHKNLKLVLLNGDLLFFRADQRSDLIKKITQLFFNQIDGVISDSEQNKECGKKFLKIPIEVCPPYPKNLSRQDIKREHWGLYVGRLDPDKNIKRIVNFGLQCPSFEKFIVVGDGVLNGWVKKMTKKHQKLVYVGPREDVAKYYSQTEFLIHLPEADPHPCTTMEAAICGCCPVMSPGVGTKYLFNSIFIIDDPKKFKEINERVKYIRENKEEANNLLAESLKKIPTEEQSINNFRNKFHEIIKGMGKINY